MIIFRMINEEWKYGRQNEAMIMKKTNSFKSYSRWIITLEERYLMMIMINMTPGNVKGTWS